MGAVTTGIMVGLTALNAASQYNALEGQADYTESQNNINKRRAAIAEKDALDRGKREMDRYGRQADQVIGSQRASLAAQGINVDVGSARDIQDESEEIKRQDMKSIENNAFREALGFSMQQMDYDANSRMSRASARSNQGATLLTAGMNAGRYMSGGWGSKPSTPKFSGGQVWSGNSGRSYSEDIA